MRHTLISRPTRLLLLTLGLVSFSNAAAAAPSPLREIATATSAARIGADVQTLADFGTRHTLSDTTSNSRGIGAARRWVKAEFEAISAACGGCLEVRVQRQVFSGEKRIS